MKKLLLALTAAVSCAFFAKADTTFNQTGFESLTAGDVLDPAKDDAGGTGERFWSYAGANMECVVSNYESGAAYTYGEGNAALVENGPGSNYLWVDASEAPLVRNVNPFVGDGHAAQSIGDGLYFDSLVQFTATDQTPAIDANQDKLIVWLYGGDEESELFGATTGLVVTAGYVDGAASTMPSNYVVTLGSGIDVKPGEWHRLTIKAISNITEDGKTVPEAAISGFVVFVDGQPVTCDDVKGDFYNVGDLTTEATALGNKLFPSLLKAGVGAGSLTGVAFDGTGAIDDLTFTDSVPFDAPAETFALTVTVTDENYAADQTALTWAIGAAGTPVAFTSGTAFDVEMPAASVVVSVPLLEGFKLVAPAGVAVAKGAGTEDPESGDVVYAWTATLNTSEYVADGEYTLALSTALDDGAPSSYVLTLSQGTGTTLSATVGGSPVNNGAVIEEDTQVTITAAISDETAYENLVVTVGGVDVTSQLVNGSYTFAMTAATTVAASASPKAAASYSMSLTGGSNASITYAVDGGAATAYAGTAVDIPNGSAVVITAAPASGYTYSGVDLTGYPGWTYDSATGNLTYTINSMSELTELEVPDAKEVESDYWTVTITLGSHVTSVSYVFVDDPATTNTLTATGSFEIEKGKSFALVNATVDDDAAYEIDLAASLATLTGATIDPTYYTITPTGAASGTIIAKSIGGGDADWPTGDALNALDGKSVSATYGIAGDLALVDAKVFTTWASGVGGVAYADRGTTTYSEECFLLNIANNSSADDIAAAKAAAATAIKITAITFDGNGNPVVAAPEVYGNGKVEIEGSESLEPVSWHEKADGDYFFRAKLVIDEVEDAS